MDQREVNFYNGTVDNLKSIAKSLKRIADFCDRIEGTIKEEGAVKEEPPKGVFTIPEDVCTSYSRENLALVRDSLIGYSNRHGKVPLRFFYNLVGLDPKTVPENRGWVSIGDGHITINPMPDGTYKLNLPPTVWI